MLRARRACGGGAGTAWASGSRRCLVSSKPPAGAEGSGGGEGGGDGDGSSVDVERRSTLRGLRQTGKDLGARLSSQLQSARGALWEESEGTKARKYLSQPEAGGEGEGVQQGGGGAGVRGGSAAAAAAAASVERLVGDAMERLPTMPDRGELDRKQRAELAARPQARLRDLPLREHLRVWRLTLDQYSTSLRPPPQPQPPARGDGVAPGAGDDGVFTLEERAAMEKDLGELRGMAEDGAASARVMLQQSPQLRALAEEKMSVVRDAMACFVEGYRDAKHEAVTGQGEQAQAVDALLRDVGIERPPEVDDAMEGSDQHAARRPEEGPLLPPPPQKQHGSAGGARAAASARQQGGDEAAGQQQQQQQAQATRQAQESGEKEDPGGSQQRK
jgi:hypothetical protein